MFNDKKTDPRDFVEQASAAAMHLAQGNKGQAGQIGMNVPRQPINLAPTSMMAGTQIRQLQVATEQPPAIETPVNVQRVALGNGVSRYFVQFFTDPADNTYSHSSAYFATANGSTEVQSAGSEGPITFTTTSSVASAGRASIGVTHTTTSGTVSSSDFGSGSTRAIDRT